jgi:hypothetical protein
MFEDERSPPDREIDKLQAIRHLLHSSIRLLLWEEDPFALHLICQSCDKLIIDCMKADGIESPVNFAAHVKPELPSGGHDSAVPVLCAGSGYSPSRVPLLKLPRTMARPSMALPNLQSLSGAMLPFGDCPVLEFD